MTAYSSVARLAKSLSILNSQSARAVFISVSEEAAVQAAAEALLRDQQGKKLSAIDGYIVAVKGNVDIQQLTTRVGSKALNLPAAQKDAPLVSDLRAAGAVILGHTNMSEFAFSGLGLNPHFGTPINPLSADEPLVPGGSSAGSASAVALGIADIAIGTDTSGSVRIPAAFQGLVGYRPSMHRYCMAGVFPLAPSLDTVGIIATTVRQIIATDLALAAINQHPLAHPKSYSSFIAPSTDFLSDCEPCVLQRFEDTLQALQNNGFNITRFDSTSLIATRLLFKQQGTLVAIEALQSLSVYMEDPDFSMDETIYQRLQAAKQISSANIELIKSSQATFQQAMVNEMNSRCLLLPTTPNSTPTISAAHSEQYSTINQQTLSYTMLSAFLNLPTIAIPVNNGFAGNSLSISGTANTDDILLSAALNIEQSLAYK
ncbi:MAG: amidase family protein [Oceanospirillaceae bacterium]